MSNPYHHYCKQCRIFYPCTHGDPEKATATGPCGHRLTLGYASFEQTKKDLMLGKSEIGEGTVTYVND